MDLRNYIENSLIVTSIALTIVSLSYDSVQIPAFSLDCVLVSLLFYTKIPSMLDKYFQTSVFKKDKTIRMGLVVFPATLLSLFALSTPFGFSLLPGDLKKYAVLDLFVPIFGAVALVFISMFYFSWRVRNTSDSGLIEKLWRKACESEDDYQSDKLLSERSKIDRLLTESIATGIVPMTVSVMLFFSWLILIVTDVLFVMFLMLLLTYNLLYEINKRSGTLTERNRLTYRLFSSLDQIVTWEDLVQTGLSRRISGIMEVLALTASFLLLVLVSLLSVAAFIVMFGLLSQWYVLLVIVQIGRRGKYKLKGSTAAKPPTLPHRCDFVLVFCLVMLLGFSMASYADLQKSTYVPQVFLVLSVILNVATISSVIFWRIREKSGLNNRGRENLGNDKYRLHGILYLLGFPVALLGKTLQGIVFWSVLNGALVWLSTDDSVRNRFKSANPQKYATMTTLHMAIGAFSIIGLIFYFLPELYPLAVVATMVFSVLLTWMWIQKFRMRTTNQEAR